MISVAIATYNGEKFLREQLESLYSQTRVPDEIVVSDDCSTDCTIEILEEFRQKYGLRYIVHENKLGINKNFEEAIRACKGNYIAICDQDDIWFPNKIQESYKKIKEIEISDDLLPCIVSSQIYHINAKGELISTSRHIRKDTYRAEDTLLYPPGSTQGCSLMFNRQLLSALKPFPSINVCLYDAYIGMVCASIGKKYNMAQPLMYYRHHSNNVVASNILKKDSLYRRIKNFIKYFFNPVSIPDKRLNVLSFIETEYGNLFNSDIKALYNRINEYRNQSSKVNRMKMVWNIKNLDFSRKLSWTLGLIIDK